MELCKKMLIMRREDLKATVKARNKALTKALTSYQKVQKLTGKKMRKTHKQVARAHHLHLKQHHDDRATRLRAHINGGGGAGGGGTSVKQEEEEEKEEEEEEDKEKGKANVTKKNHAPHSVSSDDPAANTKSPICLLIDFETNIMYAHRKAQRLHQRIAKAHHAVLRAYKKAARANDRWRQLEREFADLRREATGVVEQLVVREYLTLHPTTSSLPQ